MTLEELALFVVVVDVFIIHGIRMKTEVAMATRRRIASRCAN